MTEEEQTIANLKKLKSFHNGSYGADIDRAIRALEKQPCEDCISRANALRVAKNEYLRGWHNALCKALSEKYSFHCEEGNFSVIQEEAITGLGLSMDCALGKDVESYMSALPSVTPAQRWIPVSERLPENANHLGAFCPRYRISSAKYGVTEGWYNPDMRTWYGLVWQLTPGNIEMKRGDIPAVIRMIDVTAWMELPEPDKAESEGER